ncbi:hypothetical protein PoB_003563200 [Plakobranchus ocellatus]|uniref:Uncharacterized protein n=1 Tax=Plakobranchus ocellatus TaxID=259542 RepID=A0AAV4APA7_9GAST|nr:hypothetical protein PoB_003563200 [Plakobranchus ocellatus]
MVTINTQKPAPVPSKGYTLMWLHVEEEFFPRWWIVSPNESGAAHLCTVFRACLFSPPGQYHPYICLMVPSITLLTKLSRGWDARMMQRSVTNAGPYFLTVAWILISSITCLLSLDTRKKM